MLSYVLINIALIFYNFFKNSFFCGDAAICILLFSHYLRSRCIALFNVESLLQHASNRWARHRYSKRFRNDIRLYQQSLIAEAAKQARQIFLKIGTPTQVNCFISYGQAKKTLLLFPLSYRQHLLLGRIRTYTRRLIIFKEISASSNILYDVI